jgi:rhodanese-related sulfurtransferase
MHQGDISPAEAYQRLQNNPSAVLVDVRTQPEWVFVGVPAVERLVRLSWQVFPSMQVNGNFVAEIEQMGLPKDTEILCICRSGARSASAASALTQAGFTNAWNVAEGRCGPPRHARRLEGRGPALGAELVLPFLSPAWERKSMKRDCHEEAEVRPENVG